MASRGYATASTGSQQPQLSERGACSPDLTAEKGAPELEGGWDGSTVTEPGEELVAEGEFGVREG